MVAGVGFEPTFDAVFEAAAMTIYANRPKNQDTFLQSLVLPIELQTSEETWWDSNPQLSDRLHSV